jgi:hypothetical protein
MRDLIIKQTSCFFLNETNFNSNLKNEEEFHIYKNKLQNKVNKINAHLFQVQLFEKRLGKKTQYKTNLKFCIFKLKLFNI